MVLVGIIAIGSLLFIAWSITVFNTIVMLSNKLQNAFSLMIVPLRRRHDLITELVDVSKPYLQGEMETLEEVTRNRDHAQGLHQLAAGDPGNSDVVKRLLNAETALDGAIGQLMATIERIPQGKANQTMMKLTEEMASTEHRIAFARQGYNDAVMTYNAQRERFPIRILADMFNFQAGSLFENSRADVRKSPRLSSN